MAAVSSERWSFRLSLPNIPGHYGNGNEALYSENGMKNGTMWHVNYGPDASGTFLAGNCGLLRVSDGQPIPSYWYDVDWALKRIFTGACGTENIAVAFRSNYSDTMMKNIAFVLRGQGMEKCCGYVQPNGSWKVETHVEVKQYVSVEGVPGLITSANRIDLNQAAIYLANTFGPDLVRWVSRCVSPEGWRNSWWKSSLNTTL